MDMGSLGPGRIAERQYGARRGSETEAPLLMRAEGSGEMKKIPLEDARSYQASKQFKMAALRLHGKEESGCQAFWVGLSHYLPGGGSEFDASPSEKVYFVLEGEITVRGESGETVILHPWDSIYVKAFEGRQILNATNRPASLLVITNYTD
jgi:glyoxylate utilization-related uncharacterized protein